MCADEDNTEIQGISVREASRLRNSQSGNTIVDILSIH